MEIDITGWGLALAGGVLIGTAATILLYFNHRTCGISGMFHAMIGLHEPVGERWWRTAFVAGVIGGGMLVYSVEPGRFAAGPSSNVAYLIAAGLFTGVGTRMANGCTSGHGVCGISRLSGRSIVATLIYIGFGAATVVALRALGITS